jgi:hypothetical protein
VLAGGRDLTLALGGFVFFFVAKKKALFALIVVDSVTPWPT